MSRHWAELHRQVCFGQSGGRIIWQPRIGAWYSDKVFENEPFPAPFTGKSWGDIYRELDCSARLYAQFNPCFERVFTAPVRFRQEALNETDTASVCEMPPGTLTTITRRLDSSRRPLKLKPEVQSEEELTLATWRAEHTDWRWNQEKYEAAVAAFGDLGAPTAYMPRVTIQDLYINTMSTQTAIYAVYDWPDAVQAYFAALDASHDRLIDVINASPIEIINFGDNLHCGTLPPDFYERYVEPSYQHRCERLHAAGKFVSAHWDGDTASLLPCARRSGLDAIEAVTPKPQGDVTLETVREAFGEDMFLLDGIPAVYFDSTFPEATLVACVHRIIELFAPRLILGISDEISATGDLERLRLVGQIVDAYNEKASIPE